MSNSNDDDDVDDFKSAIPDNKIPDRGSLYERANDIFDSQYAVYNRTLIPENQWIFENNLEFFKLNVEDIDRLYSFDEKNHFNNDNYQNDFIEVTLCLRIKRRREEKEEEGGGGKALAAAAATTPLYVIFSQFNEKDKDPMYGWILLTTNFNFFVEQYFFVKKCTEDEKKNIYKFWYDDDEGIEKIEKYQHDYSITKGNYFLKCPQFIFDSFPQALRRSKYKNVASKDFGFYTFCFSHNLLRFIQRLYFFEILKSQIYNKFENLFITDESCKEIDGNNNDDYISDYESSYDPSWNHPNFKSVVPDINNTSDLNKLIGYKLGYQYYRYGCTNIPQHQWIYENKLEFFKLNIKDIDRFYFYQKKLNHNLLLLEDCFEYSLGVRVEYKKKYFLYVIYSFRRINEFKLLGTMYITTNPHLFASAPEVVKQKHNNDIYKLLLEDGIDIDIEIQNGSSAPPLLDLACHKVVISSNHKTKLQSQFSELPQILQQNINLKNAFGIIECYIKDDSYQSRIFNKFKNKFFVSE